MVVGRRGEEREGGQAPLSSKRLGVKDLCRNIASLNSRSRFKRARQSPSFTWNSQRSAEEADWRARPLDFRDPQKIRMTVLPLVPHSRSKCLHRTPAHTKTVCRKKTIMSDDTGEDSALRRVRRREHGDSTSTKQGAAYHQLPSPTPPPTFHPHTSSPPTHQTGHKLTGGASIPPLAPQHQLFSCVVAVFLVVLLAQTSYSRWKRRTSLLSKDFYNIHI